MFRHIESTRHGTVDVVRILERRLVDGDPLDDLRAEIGQVVGAHRGIHLLFDLGNVEFLATKVDASKIMLGSDFPFGETHPVEFVMSSKVLSDEVKADILGVNAAKFLGVSL
jgi:hypothetical protein